MVKTPDWETSPGATLALLKSGTFVSADLISISFTKQPGHAPTPPFNLPGIITQASAAYSTRLLRTAYTGPLLKVWRSSDNTTKDIFPRANGDLDILTMGTFVGAGDGRCAKWYDQSGNGNDITPVGLNNANAPRLIISGSGFTIGTHPAMKMVFGSSDTNLLINGGPFMGQNQGAAIIVANAATGGNGNNAGFPNGGTPNRGLFEVTQGAPQTSVSMAFASSTFPGSPACLMQRCTAAFTPHFSVVPYTFATDAIFLYRYSTSDSTPNKGYIDGGTPVTESSALPNGNSNSNSLAIGTCIGNIFDGLFSECIFFAQEPATTDVNVLGANMSSWWGPGWTNISV